MGKAVVMKHVMPQILSLVLFACAALAQPVERPSVTFGIVPQQAAAKLAQLWSPILNYVGERANCQIVFKTAKDIPTFEERLLAGEYDLSYMNPYHYTVAHAQQGYVAFARQANKKIRGIIVVRADSPINDLEALDGSEMCFPSPAAFAASILPQAYLGTRSIEVRPKYVSSHDSVYRNVAMGRYVAGGGIERTLANVDTSVSNKLRVLYKTEGYTPHAFAAHPRIDSAQVEAIGRVLYEMASDSLGAVLLQSIQFAGVEQAQNADWDDIRALQIDKILGKD
jgi:phosphonate transport system substrate-binding protein